MSRHEKWLLTKVFVVLAVYKLLLFFFPFNRFMTAEKALPFQKIEASEEIISEVIWAIHLVSSKIPMGFTCLIQVLAAKWLLRSQPEIRVRIGVQKTVTEGFSAHAWLAYQNKIILGQQANQSFEPILEWN